MTGIIQSLRELESKMSKRVNRVAYDLDKGDIKSLPKEDVSANAIKNVAKKCVIKVPKKLVKKYQKEFSKKTGFKKEQ